MLAKAGDGIAGPMIGFVSGALELAGALWHDKAGNVTSEAGMSVDTALTVGSSVSIILVGEFEPELGILDADTEEPSPPLAG